MTNWINPKITSADCKTGRGQFATQAIAKGELLVVLGGDVVTVEEWQTLPPEVKKYPNQINADPDLMFGPTRMEDVSEGDHLNHNCNPNAGFGKNSTHLLAMRDIAAGEEITFDYAMSMTTPHVFCTPFQCECGAKECRGTVSENDYKNKVLQEKYKGYWQPYIEKKIQQENLNQQA